MKRSNNFSIGLEGLEVICIIGAHPHERVTEQALLLDLEFKPREDKSLESDQLDDTVDYTEVAAVCNQVAHAGKYHLLEKLAHATAKKLMELFNLQWVKVKVKKRRPIPYLAFSGVEVYLGEEESDG